MGRERRRGAPEGMDHENTLGRPDFGGGINVNCYDQENNRQERIDIPMAEASEQAWV